MLPDTIKVILFSILFFSSNLNAQVIIKIKDDATKKPIENSEIHHIETDQIHDTDTSGCLQLSETPHPYLTLRIFAEGYENALVKLNNSKRSEHTVYLKSTNFNLKEITLSKTKTRFLSYPKTSMI